MKPRRITLLVRPNAQVSALAAAVVVFTPIAVISLGTGDHDQQIRFAR